jgi:hypothetical protein
MSSDATNGNPPVPKRQFERYTSYRDLAVNYEGYSEEIPVHIPDISIHGMFINTPHQFPNGAVLNVKFTLTRSNYEVQARSEVRYCLPGVGVGLEFIEISPEAQKAIEEELRVSETMLR